MIKFKNLLRHIMAGLLIAFFVNQEAKAQCTVTSNTDGCVGVSETFKVSGPDVLNNDSIVWVFNNGKSKGETVTNIWNTPTGGSSPATSVPVEMRIYAGGVVKCSKTVNITIHENPIADFKLLSPTPQCFNGNSFEYDCDVKTPSGNPIVWKEFFYGDGKIDSGATCGKIGPYSMKVVAAGGQFTPQLKIRDSKGCIAFVQKPALITIRPDLGANFTTPNPTNCLSTSVVLTNTSLIPQNQTKSFTWEFGDGSAKNTTDWANVAHTYTKNGCFIGKLIIESNDGCFDTAVKQAACNTNPALRVSVKNGDVQCVNNQNFIFEHPVVQNATFLWSFDDPPSGNLNTDNQNWSAPHEFTGIGPYNVTFRLFTNGCMFDTIYPVHVKGPGALLETRANQPGITFVRRNQRYQCKIRDTVRFVNQSGYYLNDEEPFNDFYYISMNQEIFQFIDETHLNVQYDTIDLKTGVAQNLVTRTGKNVYVSADGSTIAINGDTLEFDGNKLVKGLATVMRDAPNSKNSHTVRIWDFDDNVAPQCTTDSRPIYPKLAKYNNLHFPGTLAPRNTYDANGKWINCNFSHDSLPKHWYTPGEERCYTVQFNLKDTSKKDPQIRAMTSSNNDPAMPDSACESTASIRLALQAPNANGLRWEGIPCYGPSNVYGFEFNFSRTGPSCDRQQYWFHFDSLADRLDATPNVLNKWVPQSGTVVDRNFTPWSSATNSGTPPNVGGIFWQYQPNGTYPSKIASPDGWVTIGLRIQNGVDPVTGQPCVDEKWYHNAYRYIQANPAFKFYDGVNTNNIFTFSRTCSPQDIFVKRDSTFLPASNKSTYSSDSIGAEIWNWGDGVVEIDSFFRYIPVGGSKFINYRIRYKMVDNSPPVVTDSLVTRVFDAATGKTTYVSEKDSTPDILRSHRYTNQARNVISHTIVPCQKLPIDSMGVTVYRRSCCDNPPFLNARVAITGFLSDIMIDDTIVCKNSPVQFYDTARYYLFSPILTYPFILDEHDYWADPTVDANGNFRPQPNPGQYESIRWNFGDGMGWQTNVPNDPSISYSAPGQYDVQVEYTDSVGCKQLIKRKIRVSGVSGNFSFNKALSNCSPTVNFTDTSLMLDPCRLVNNTKCDEIVKWEWDFGDNKGTQSISILQNPSKLYTAFGDYEITLKVTTKLGCTDSIKRTISLEGPRPKFEFAADSVGCVPFTVELRNISINPTQEAEWTWFFGDGDFLTTKADSNVTHTYDSAGVYEIFLLQNDLTSLGSGKCDGIYPDTGQTNGNYRKFIVRVLPSRKTAFTVGDSILCVGDSTQFTSNSDTIYSNFNWIWENNTDTTKGTKANGGDKQWHKFDKPGTWYVQLRPTYVPQPGEPACPTSAVKKVVVREVDARLVCDTNSKPFIYFKNESVNAQDIWWDFGDGNGFVDGTNLPDYPNASYNYGENKGYYLIRLAVKSPEGCVDTAWCDFDYDFQVKINPPNVFTPGDGNSLNDLFDVEVLNEEKYEVGIFNRWGEQMFKAENKDAKWDGKNMNTGADCPAGVYFVVINYRLRGQADKVYRGTLTLIRNK
jgi:gliding motility-associated-like protein